MVDSIIFIHKGIYICICTLLTTHKQNVIPGEKKSYFCSTYIIMRELSVGDVTYALIIIKTYF